ncbi:hypothetical protein CHS0354_031841 [Potamilus streckersoni]|uniref:Uncharacterized protein n=1 Tax=Potamilus streckersoni TaxID=2493646 RepID=A0AAE0VLV8_9BIVA|nr:hypothetical protein CHS0354_031841 [Potamilus streckersoni]
MAIICSRRTSVLVRRKETAKYTGKRKPLTRRYHNAVDGEKKGLSNFRDNPHEKTKTLKRAKNVRKNKRERIQKRTRFTANPLGLVKELLGDERSGRFEYRRRLEKSLSYLRCTDLKSKKN